MSAQVIDIRSGHETIRLERQAWDSQVLGLSCGRITDFSPAFDPHPDYLSLVGQMTALGFDYVTARRPQGEWKRLHALEAAGFRLVDSILAFSKSAAGVETSLEEGLRPARSADASTVAELSVRTFRQSRFHNDPFLTSAQAEAAHRAWATNAVLGQVADIVWVAEADNHLAGFITCRLRGPVGTIELIGVDPQFAGRGFGRRLVQAACAWFKDQGCVRIEVQTQGDNLPALRLYTKSAFDFAQASFTLAWARAR